MSDINMATLSEIIVKHVQSNSYYSADEKITKLVELSLSTGKSCLENKQFGDAINCFEFALLLNPENQDAQFGGNQAYCKIIPRWHFEMLNDEMRNAVFDQALAKAVTKGTTVLDIGSGTGLLAMMAARAGAREVISCEMIAPN